MTNPLTIDVRSWQPPSEVTSLTGRPLPPGRDYFVQPPAEIGPVTQAWTELRVGQGLWPLWIKLAVAAAFLVVGGGVLLWLKSTMPPGQKPGLAPVIIFLVTLCVPILAVAMAFRVRYLAYVGTEGAAVYRTRGTRADAAGQAVRFADVADIETKTVSVAKNGRNSTWVMNCLGADGRSLMKLKGNTHGPRGPATIYVIAQGIHRAWEQQHAKSTTQA